MGPELIIAFTLPLMAISVVLGFLFYVYKLRARKLDALIKVVELTGNSDPETLKMLSGSGDGSNHKSDIRTGMIWLAVGMPLCIGMYLDEGIGAAVYGLIPVLIGVAYLISARFRLREQ